MPMLERSEGDIHYEVCDIVPPWQEPRETILFLHGLAVDSDIWITWLPILADRYRIIRMDLRGFGRSFVPAEGADWSIDAMADDVLDVLAALGTQRVHFVGESTGGTVGLHLAAHHPGRLQTLTMVSAAHRGGTIGRAQALRDDVHGLGMDAWSAKLMPLRFPAGCLSPAMERWFHDTQRASAPQACVDLVDMLVQVDLTEALGGIRRSHPPDRARRQPLRLARDASGAAARHARLRDARGRRRPSRRRLFARAGVCRRPQRFFGTPQPVAG